MYELIDIWRQRNPNEEKFTWRNKSFKIQCRLDYFLISRQLVNLTNKCTIVFAPETDHSAIFIHLQSAELKQKKGPGFWKFNQSLLHDETYVSLLRAEIEKFKQKYTDVEDLNLRWDLIKIEIRGFTLKYSKIKSKERKSTETILQSRINDLFKRAEAEPNNKHIICEIQSIRLRLRKIMQYKTKGAILRSKVRWYEDGERNTRYFYNLEKRNYEKKTIAKLKRSNGTVTNDQFEILQEQMEFYKALYTSATHLRNSNDAVSASAFFENIAPLENTDQQMCEGKVSAEECLKALNDFQNEKSPGTDGLPAEFYKFFWKELHLDMIKSFNFAFDTGTLSISQRRGIITLIPKPNKDATSLENLRPISLLNVDYKILTKTIAKRLEKVLPKIINPDQTGYVKGRYIGENVRLISDIMSYTNEKNMPGVALFIDFRKAFDTIEWDFLSDTLSKFNFGPDVKNWVKIFYNNVTSCVLNNGHASEFFTLERGVRQGCPLSGLLFVIGIEVLANAIRNKNTIKGIKVGDKEIKTSLYADDTTVFVRDLDSIPELLALLNHFRNLSGLEINATKTEGMWLGRWKSSLETPFGFRWPQDPIKALGIFFSYDSRKAIELNFIEKIRNLEKTLNSWKRRNLTLLGKINIVKTLALSKLIYSTSVLVIPEQLIKEINSIIFDFIWDEKPPKIKKSTIIGEKKHGGLKMTDFNILNKALKVAWIPRIKSENVASWKIIPNVTLESYGGLQFLINCNYDIDTLQVGILPSFYVEVLKQWQMTKDTTRGETPLTREEVIWNNRKILINGNPVFYKSWFDQNVIRIQDLLQEDGNFLSFKSFCNQFKFKTPFTLYFGLINSILTSWRLVSENPPSLCPENEEKEKIISTKYVYNLLLKNSFVPPTAEAKILRHGFTPETVQKVYELPFQIKHDIKITMFQYKIIHNILATKKSLFRANFSDNDVCPQCLAETHSLDHMFLRCSSVVEYWKTFQNWWTNKTKEQLTLSNSMILYGVFEKTEHRYSLNYVLLIAKFSIYCSCLHDEKLSFDSFLMLLKEKLNIQKEIALKNKSITAFQKSFQHFL